MPTQDRILVVGDDAEIGGLLRDSYRFAGWTLDVATRNHTAPDGVVVALSGTECRLLRVFLDQPNRVLTQDQLIDLMLSRDAAPFDRAIVVQVSRLRHRRRRVPRKSVAPRAFNTMQARLAAYICDRTRVLAALSHDLKTPITRLRLRSELLEDPQARAKLTKDLDEMETKVGATLDFLRGQESGEPVRPVDVMALLDRIEGGLEARLTLPRYQPGDVRIRVRDPFRPRG